MINIKATLLKRAEQVNSALDRYLPTGETYPAKLAKAMRYSVFSGGKRVRPFLVLETAKMCGGSIKDAMPLACAVEMIHAYSLVHDDLPSMDDDDMRRGRPTCHIKFGEATAILAGDALLSLAFEVAADKNIKYNGTSQQIIRALSHAIGPYGMVGGQAADLQYQQATTKTNQFSKKKIPVLTQINRLKTGALIQASTELGALAAKATPKQIEHCRNFGQHIGFLFQLVDDILDRDGFYSLLGKDKVYEEAAKVRDKAKLELKQFKKGNSTLLAFTDLMYERRK